MWVWVARIERWWRAGGVEIVGVDISGRHAEDGEYRMVAAAVHAEVASTAIKSILGVAFAQSTEEPTLSATVALVESAVSRLPAIPAGPVVAERGEFYQEPDWAVEGHLTVEPEFKYVESIAERETVQAAHHAAYGARKLLL